MFSDSLHLPGAMSSQSYDQHLFQSEMKNEIKAAHFPGSQNILYFCQVQLPISLAVRMILYFYQVRYYDLQSVKSGDTKRFHHESFMHAWSPSTHPPVRVAASRSGQYEVTSQTHSHVLITSNRITQTARKRRAKQQGTSGLIKRRVPLNTRVSRLFLWQ